MPRTRKSRPPSLKAKVEVETIRAHKTAAQIAQMFASVRPRSAARRDGCQRDSKTRSAAIFQLLPSLFITKNNGIVCLAPVEPL